MTWEKSLLNHSANRQRGMKKNVTPLPLLHDRPSTTKLALGRIAIVLMIAFWISYIFSIIIRQLFDGPQSYDFTMEAFSYAFVVSILTFSSLVYLITRQGALERFLKHTRVPRAILDQYFSHNQPTITVLVPSYSEENQVIRKTLLSAALQEYPNIRIVLLLDDNPHQTNPDDIARLDAARVLGNDLTLWLSEPYSRFSQALTDYKRDAAKRSTVSAKVVQTLADHYRWASNWLHQMANEEPSEDHVDQFFSDQVLRQLGNDLLLVARALDLSAADTAQLSKQRVQQLYQRLTWIFQADFEVFERKKFMSLSHDANKAMNLNSYIGLMGANYRQQDTSEGPILIATKKRHPLNINIPDSEFLLTLDADSILLREYCLRLVYFLQQPNNTDVAVTQTPYSSFPGAYSRIERLAGATTDIQHILHQGMSKFGATFWVGANAIIRKRALNDIVEKEWIGGFEIKRYIQDRTVIEDTESSIDLAVHGWQLMNYPERLSYSATPPDFGSLVVQRRRWANGGLLILPKFWSQIRRRKNQNETISTLEIMLRVNYMTSIAWATVGLIFLLAYPYDGRLLSPLVVLAAFPYFLTMASDLQYSGYKYSDIFRIYGFNLILLPVNLAGVLKSLEQAITGKKIPFARTPKVKNRTPVSLLYVLGPLLIVGFSIFTVWRNVEAHNWGNALFAGFNTFAASWAIIAYIGVGNMMADMWLHMTNWLYVEHKTKEPAKKSQPNPELDWKAVLYHGESRGVLSHVNDGDPSIEPMYINEGLT